MKLFSGFPEGKVRQVRLPDPFFSELLPQIDDLGELKVILYAFWRLDHLEGSFRFLRRRDFMGEAGFMQRSGVSGKDAEAALDGALERAVRRGALLRAYVGLEGQNEALYFLNTPRGRALVQAIANGDWRVTGEPEAPVEIILDTPNIFKLYEENIGPITPMIAETLRDAEKSYPLEWIEEAIRIAVESNARTWRYVTAILDRWKEEGKVERKDRRDTEKARRRYAEWENPGGSG
jgi:DnaD/phage-associated family protein